MEPKIEEERVDPLPCDWTNAEHVICLFPPDYERRLGVLEALRQMINFRDIQAGYEPVADVIPITRAG